jgi:diaminohydroxyphosphoribosylaminopyrimidine deaminase / 5-amino-6-(5-phosphoribosylamino)uracil reductase
MPARAPSNAGHWMAKALALAHRGEALASPNPMVGAVLVRRGRVVGQGFHTYDGLRHAEIVALESAGAAARGATLYVNLEPCCHTGRTGPCTDAIIAAGVARVVAAMPDPNPAVAGRGFRELRAAGIAVETGILRDQAQRLNEAFSVWITARRPFVTLKSALTLDGRLVLPGARWITSPASRAEVQRMRHASDALLTGIGTVLADDPLLTDRSGLPRRRRLLRVVVDSALRLPRRSRLVRSAREDVLVFTSSRAPAARVRALRRAGVEVLVDAGHSSSRPGLRRLLAELARRDILSVLLEAGPTLNQAALHAGLVDKVRFFYAPKLAGIHSQAPALSRPQARDVRELSGVRIDSFGPDFAVEAYLRDAHGK